MTSSFTFIFIARGAGRFEPCKHIQRLLVLQSYQGDMEEALNFLKMTTLTATPAQLGKLGLISKKSAKTLDQTPPGSNPGSGSGDETLLALAQNARQMIGRPVQIILCMLCPFFLPTK